MASNRTLLIALAAAGGAAFLYSRQKRAALATVTPPGTAVVPVTVNAAGGPATVAQIPTNGAYVQSATSTTQIIDGKCVQIDSSTMSDGTTRSAQIQKAMSFCQKG